MKYLLTFEQLGNYDPTPFDKPMITDYSQGTPNGMAGSFNGDSDWKKIESPLNNGEVKRVLGDIKKDFKNKKRKKRRL